MSLPAPIVEMILLKKVLLLYRSNSCF